MELPKVNFPIKKYLALFTKGLTRFQVAVTLIIIAGLVAMATLTVEANVDPPVDQNAVNKRLGDLKSVDFDEDAISAIEQLNDSGIDITSDFVNSRDNPFFED